LVLYLFTTIATLAFVPRALLNFHTFPWLWVVPVLHVLAVANIPRCIFIGAPGWAFLSSMANIASLVALFGISLFPYIVPSVSSAAAGLSIFDAASSKNTLTLGLYIVGAGMPLILSYTAVIYWTFRGKTVLDAHSY
jgi:cytochrome d ubiquinol oxidase subunit II